MYIRPLLKYYLRILLLQMGFAGAFLVQDHVAATFGAGLGHALVVDMGDQKTSISCVEDGISNPQSRIQLDYGGSDITRILFFLLRKIGFPFQVKSDFEERLLSKFKDSSCHLNLDLCGIFEKILNGISFFVGDELIIAPMAIFHTELLEVTGSRKMVRFLTPDQGDPEDPHDHIYLNDTSRKYTKTATEGGDLDGAPSQVDDDLDIVIDNINSNSNSSENLLPLDTAILKSIEACGGNEELKRKMYSCILLVGGGLKFNGIDKYLRQKLILQVPFALRSDPMEIIIDAKEMSSTITTWKGAAILATLESAAELWIRPREFAKHGQKLLREKAAFPWV